MVSDFAYKSVVRGDLRDDCKRFDFMSMWSVLTAEKWGKLKVVRIEYLFWMKWRQRAFSKSKMLFVTEETENICALKKLNTKRHNNKST